MTTHRSDPKRYDPIWILIIFLAGVFLFVIIIAMGFVKAINNQKTPYEIDQALLKGEITEKEYCEYFENSLRPPVICVDNT